MMMATLKIKNQPVESTNKTYNILSQDGYITQ